MNGQPTFQQRRSLYQIAKTSFLGSSNQGAYWSRQRPPRIPLLNAGKFLCISCGNLDEFFEIPGRREPQKELLKPARFVSQGGPGGSATCPSQLGRRFGTGAALRPWSMSSYQVLNDGILAGTRPERRWWFVSRDVGTGSGRMAAGLFRPGGWSPCSAARPWESRARGRFRKDYLNKRLEFSPGGGRKARRIRPQQRPLAVVQGAAVPLAEP